MIIRGQNIRFHWYPTYREDTRWTRYDFGTWYGVTFLRSRKMLNCHYRNWTRRHVYFIYYYPLISKPHLCLIVARHAAERLSALNLILGLIIILDLLGLDFGSGIDHLGLNLLLRYKFIGTSS